MPRAELDRGFTLIELMIAGSMALILSAGAFALLNDVQRVSGRQAAADEVVASARVAMEVMARDIRSAGDGLELLPAPCLGETAYEGSPFLCPAVLDAHPWRIAIARNTWQDSDGDGTTFGVTDAPPPTTRLFESEPQNVVGLRFVPHAAYAAGPKTIKDGSGATRRGVLGKIERVVNPFRFPGGAGDAVVTVLLDNVLLDDAMRLDPLGSGADHRFDTTLFSYRLLTRKDEFSGALGKRNTSADGLFVSPPLRFFAPAAPPAFTTAAPWVPSGATKELVGLETTNTSVQKLFTAGNGSMNPAQRDSDYRNLLDHNRIRAVRIGFKAVDTRERPGYLGGIDLDGNPANGTALVHAFETEVELKVLANRML